MGAGGPQRVPGYVSQLKLHIGGGRMLCHAADTAAYIPIFRPCFDAGSYREIASRSIQIGIKTFTCITLE